MKVWMRGAAASRRASAARSMSRSSARASPQTPQSRTARATACTASKSPVLAVGKPASITSTRMRSSALAMRTFSSRVMEAPGLCSPSRRVVSKMISLSRMGCAPSEPRRPAAPAWNPSVGPGRRILEFWNFAAPEGPMRVCLRCRQGSRSRSDSRTGAGALARARAGTPHRYTGAVQTVPGWLRIMSPYRIETHVRGERYYGAPGLPSSGGSSSPGLAGGGVRRAALRRRRCTTVTTGPDRA